MGHTGAESARLEPGLALTGERTLPEVPDENYWFRRHEAAYRWFVPFARGAVALDVGCGEGYGAALLATSALSVAALDRNDPVVRHVARRYASLHVVAGDASGLPVRDGALEVVASLQVLEHMEDSAGLLAECARAPRPAGTLLLTTPNRLTFPSADGAGPLNPFHTRELSARELRKLLEPRYRVQRLWGLRHADCDDSTVAMATWSPLSSRPPRTGGRRSCGAGCTRSPPPTSSSRRSPPTPRWTS